MRSVFLFLFIPFLFFSCKKAKPCEDSKMDCSAIRCFAFLSHFEFRLVDKANGNDLVFGSNPRYLTNDVKLYYDAARTFPNQITIDVAGKKFMTMFSKEVMYLEIKGVDVYKLTADFRGIDCCSNRVKTLWIDGLMTCSCCTDVASLAVK